MGQEKNKGGNNSEFHDLYNLIYAKRDTEEKGYRSILFVFKYKKKKCSWSKLETDSYSLTGKNIPFFFLKI